MTATASSTPPLSDEQVIAKFTRITFAFCGSLGLILILGVTVLSPHSSIGMPGVLVGVALGLGSWFGSRWITSFGISRIAGTGPTDLAGAVGTAAFMGIGMADAPALIGLVLATGDGADVGPIVIGIPIAILAVIVNASGPGAVRRHLHRLRA